MPAKKTNLDPKLNPEKELPAPQEKLLRSPTFFEKNTWIKPLGIILVLFIIVLLINISNQKNNRPPDYKNMIPPTAGQIQNNQTTNTMPDWETYYSATGSFSIKYPREYLITEENSTSTIHLTSNELPGINTNFQIAIQFKDIQPDQTLQQLIYQYPICSANPQQSTVPGSINGEDANIPAQFYVDANCDQNLQTVAYTINNNMLYIITLASQAKFGDIKPYADKIISTLKFSENSSMQLPDKNNYPSPACNPRPACLDANPRCAIPETPDMCPKAEAPPPQGIACADDAKQCPDGSWVGRSGPSCDFYCPYTQPGSDGKAL